MSGQLLRKFAFPSGQKASVFIAETVKAQGFTRVVSAIEPKIKEDIAQKAEAVLIDETMVPAHIQEQCEELVVTSLDHESQSDKTLHATALLKNKKGDVLGKIHIANNPKDQKPMRP